MAVEVALALVALLAAISAAGPPGSPMLIFTTSKDIRVANISRPHKMVNTIVKDLEGGAAVDFYYEGELVCWTDHKTGIHCISYNGTHTGRKTNVVTSRFMTPDGLAVDWLTEKLYWTDGELGRIEVATLDGTSRNVLFWEDIDRPRAIALVPAQRLMFWTDWGEVAKIERASMDGDVSSRRPLVLNDVFWPNGLTVDFNNNKIYWVDGKLKFIEMMDYDGKNRKKIIEKVILYPISITFFNDQLFWTSWETWSVHTLDRRVGNESARELIHCAEQVPIDVRVMEPSRQPRSMTPCSVNNGGCSHLCLLSATRPSGYTCSCPTGVKLIDNHTCANGPKELLLSVQTTEISFISLDTPDHTVMTLSLKGIKHAVAIDYDPVHGFIYWTDDEARVIRRARLDGLGQEDVVSSELQQPDGVAVDWRAGNLYWSDTGTDRIQVARLNTSYTRVLVSTDLNDPRAVAVSPDEGLMFWTDWYERRPKLERAALDGSSRRVLIQDGLGWPNGIALDIPAKKVYYCDAKTDRIEVINYDGTDRKEVITDNVLHLFGLTLLGDRLYWTDWQRRVIDSAHKITGTDRKVIIEQANLMGLKAIGELPKPTKFNPCAANNGNCSHLCLNTPDKYVCACQMGYELVSNGLDCVVPKAFLLFARKDVIGRISIENPNGHNNAVIPVSGIKAASAIDFDINDNRIYWADVKAKAIARAYINGSNVEKIIEIGLESPEGIAVDWLAQNIYWTDTGTKRIEVARLDGAHRKAIIWSGLQEPRSIVVDPEEGYIYWSEWSGGGSLERARLDGSGVRPLIRRLGRAKSLVIDWSDRRLYWCSISSTSSSSSAARATNNIESANLDGTKRTAIASSPRPFAMTIHEDHIYWLDWSGTMYRADKRTGANRTAVESGLEQVTGVAVYQRNTARPSWGACSAHNSGCPALCLHAQCHCPTHYTLSPHITKCIPPSSFMLFASKFMISRLVLNGSECPDAPLPIVAHKSVKAIEYDPVQQAIYWIDSKSAIRRWSEEGNGVSSAVVVGGQSGGLAIDSYARVLFWVSPEHGVINATRLDNNSSASSAAASAVTIVRARDIDKFIALHPLKGLLFWVTKEDVNTALLYKSRCDGMRRTVLLSTTSAVTALTVDTKYDTLYWATTDNRIEAVTIHGKNRREIARTTKKVSGLAVMGQSVYWLQFHSVYAYDKGTDKIKEAFVSHNQLTALVAVNPLQKKANTEWECLSGEKVSSYMECGRDVACTEQQFACRESPGDCIPTVWRCDAVTDCMDASDEADCPSTCPPDKFHCRLTAQCIDLAFVCDGTNQCSDGSDERNCCAARGGHLCAKTCLSAELVCDGWANCADGSDESDEACRRRHSSGTPLHEAASGPIGSGPVSPQQPQPSSGHHTQVLLVSFIMFTCLLLLATAVNKCRMRMKPGRGGDGVAGGGVGVVGGSGRDPALDPLAPHGGASAGAMKLVPTCGGSWSSQPPGSTGTSGGRSGYQLAPPPSPATCRGLLGGGGGWLALAPPPPPTPCSTAEPSCCQDTDTEPLPPPPTPTSLSPSPSSSTYFHHQPAPPPPSPTP